MTDNNNAQVMTWFQQQQTPAGWFDLLLIMVDGMVNNAGELESQPFLRQMGEALADEHPLPESETLGGFKPQESIPGYNANPDETKYYGGMTAGGDGGRPCHNGLFLRLPAGSEYQ